MTWTGDRRQRPRNGARRLPERLRQRVLSRYPACQLAIPGICIVTSTQVHHVIDSADGGPDAEFLADGTPQLVGVCAPCHRRVSARNSSIKGNAVRNRPTVDVAAEPIPFRSYTEMSRWQ